VDFHTKCSTLENSPQIKVNSKIHGFRYFREFAIFVYPRSCEEAELENDVRELQLLLDDLIGDGSSE